MHTANQPPKKLLRVTTRLVVFFILHLYAGWVLFFAPPFMKFYLHGHVLGMLSDVLFWLWIVAWTPWSIALVYGFIDLETAVWTSILYSLVCTSLYHWYLRHASRAEALQLKAAMGDASERNKNG